MDSGGNIFLGDTYNQRIRNFAGRHHHDSRWKGAPAASPTDFDGAIGVAIDASGDPLIVGSSSVQRITRTESSTRSLALVGPHWRGCRRQSLHSRARIRGFSERDCENSSRLR